MTVQSNDGNNVSGDCRVGRSGGQRRGGNQGYSVTSRPLGTRGRVAVPDVDFHQL